MCVQEMLISQENVLHLRYHSVAERCKKALKGRLLDFQMFGFALKPESLLFELCVVEAFETVSQMMVFHVFSDLSQKC